MRIRSIKPEFWRSSDISGLAIEDRLLFIGMWSYVDDNGVGLDKLSAITADLFADDLERDPSDTFARVSRGLQHLSASGRIVRYTVESVDYLSITNWSKHQRIDRPGKARLPQYDAEYAIIREGVASLPVNVSPGSGNRGTGDQGTGSRGSSEPNGPGASAEPAQAKNGNDTPHHRATDVAYEATGKAFNFMAVRGMAKWMLEERGLSEDQATQSIIDTYRAGKPITKQVLGQLIDGYNQNTSGSQRRLQQGLDLVQRVAARGEGAYDYDPFAGKAIES